MKEITFERKLIGEPVKVSKDVVGEYTSAEMLNVFKNIVNTALMIEYKVYSFGNAVVELAKMKGDHREYSFDGKYVLVLDIDSECNYIFKMEEVIGKVS